MSDFYYAYFYKEEPMMGDVYLGCQTYVSVEFPQCPGCLTWGDDFYDAYDMAKDALKEWLKHADAEQLKLLTVAIKPPHVSDKVIVCVPVERDRAYANLD